MSGRHARYARYGDALDFCACSDCVNRLHADSYEPRHGTSGGSGYFYADRAPAIVARHSLPETAPRTSTGEGVASFSSSRQNDATNPPT